MQKYATFIRKSNSCILNIAYALFLYCFEKLNKITKQYDTWTFPLSLWIFMISIWRITSFIFVKSIQICTGWRIWRAEKENLHCEPDCQLSKHTGTQVEYFKFVPVRFPETDTALFCDHICHYFTAQLPRWSCYSSAQSPFASCSHPLSVILLLPSFSFKYWGWVQSVSEGQLYLVQCSLYLQWCCWLHLKCNNTQNQPEPSVSLSFNLFDLSEEKGKRCCGDVLLVCVYGRVLNL